MDFGAFKFEVIDISVRGTPDLFVNVNGLTVTKKAIEDMSYPAYVRPLIDVEHRAFAIQTCRQTEERAIKFSKPRGEQMHGISLPSHSLYQTIKKVMRSKWHDGMRYRIPGIYYPDAKAMVFDLNSAEELPPLRASKSKQE